MKAAPLAAMRAALAGKVQPQWGPVAMGDHNAVDCTQMAHCNVLRRAGCLHDADMLVYEDPLPRSGTYEDVMVWLMIMLCCRR